MFCVGRRWVCVAARPPRRRENAVRAVHQVYHHLHACGASWLAHAEVASGEQSVHVPYLSAGVFSIEPCRVPKAGKVTHCLFDKTGTLTTEELVSAGVVTLRDSWSKGKVRDASVESSLELSACQALVLDSLTLRKRGKYALVMGSPKALGALCAEGLAPPWYETAYLELAEQGCRVLGLALRQLNANAHAFKLS